MKEIKDNINRWRDIPCSWIGRINIVKRTILPKAIYRFSGIPINNGIFHRTKTKNFSIQISQSVWKHKRSWIAKAILREINGAEGINLPDFRPCYKATVAKTIWYWHTNRNRDKWDKIGRYTHVLFWQKRQEYTVEKKQCLLKDVTWTATCNRMKLEYFQTVYTKMNSKFIKDLNVRPETIKLLK